MLLRPLSPTCEACDLDHRSRNGTLKDLQQRRVWGECHQASELGPGTGRSRAAEQHKVGSSPNTGRRLEPRNVSSIPEKLTGCPSEDRPSSSPPPTPLTSQGSPGKDLRGLEVTRERGEQLAWCWVYGCSPGLVVETRCLACPSSNDTPMRSLVSENQLDWALCGL